MDHIVKRDIPRDGARGIPAQTGFQSHKRAAARTGAAAQAQVVVSDSETRCDASSLRFPVRARRGLTQLGRHERPQPESRRQEAGGADGGSSALLWLI